MQKSYNIDRQTASRLLNVSIRTIDRYLYSGRLSSVRNNGRVWLSNDDVRRILKGIETDIDNQEWQQTEVDTEKTNKQTQTDKVYYGTVKERASRKDKLHEDDTDTTHTQTKSVNNKTAFYQNLYEEIKGELQEKQSMLDQATYRIGQLEAQLSTMIPLIELQRQQKALTETTENYEKALLNEKTKAKEVTNKLLHEIDHCEKILKNIEKEVEIERFNKSIIAVVLFIVLFMQPILWLLLK
jgi:hypothetical protein